MNEIKAMQLILGLVIDSISTAFGLCALMVGKEETRECSVQKMHEP